jgi:hypothetical protein
MISKYISVFEFNMTLIEGDGSRVINKFNGENFNLLKFKLEMGLASVDLWAIVDESEASPHSNVDPKVKKKYQRRVKKTISIIALKLEENQLGHIKSCKGTTEV